MPRQLKPLANLPISAVVITVKPQRMSLVLDDLKGSVARDRLVMSIVAGTSIEG